MASIKVMLNKSRIRADKTYPVVAQIISGCEKRLIYFKCYLYEDDFDPLTGRVVKRKGRRPTHLTEIDNQISTVFFELESIVKKFEKKRVSFKAVDVVECYHSRQSEVSVLNYINSLANDFKEAGKYNTANSYKSTANRIAGYINNDVNFSFLDITVNWLTQFVDYLKLEGLRTSTVGFYIRVLSSSYHKAIINELFEPTIKSPFSSVKIAIQKTPKRAVSSETITAIAGADLSSDSKMDFSRDIFMASFYSRGMSFVDIAKLKWSDIKNGNITYVRSKTRQIICVEVGERLMNLFLKYKTDSEYIFPIITSDTKLVFTQCCSSLRRTNEGLAKLSAHLKLSDKLTTYVARHSWATIAKKIGVSLAVISESLGHASEMTTRIYLKEFDSSVLHRTNALVCSCVLP